MNMVMPVANDVNTPDNDQLTCLTGSSCGVVLKAEGSSPSPWANCDISSMSCPCFRSPS